MSAQFNGGIISPLLPSLREDPEEEVYLLLSKEHRVSRSVRVAWLFDHLSKQILPDHQQLNESSESGKTITKDLRVISARCHDNSLRPTTNLYYIGQNCSLVFVVDMTTSMMQVSNETFRAKLDEATAAVEKCMIDLIEPIEIEGSIIEPFICISVIAYTSSVSSAKRGHPVEVIFQGAHLHKETIGELVNRLKDRLHRLENRPTQQQGEVSMDTLMPDTSLESILKVGLLGIQLLPRSDIKGIVVLTDGVGGFATPTFMLATVNQLRSTNISCWVVLCGGGTSPGVSLGGVVDMQALEHLTQSCSGCVLDPKKILSGCRDNDTPINPVQQCILVWSLQHSAWERRVLGVSLSRCLQEDPFVPQSPYKYQRSLVKAPALRVIGCRIREGYTIKSIVATESEIEIVMWYPWQPDITIEYTIQTSFPFSHSDSSLLVTISFSAPYHFVRDFLNEPDLRVGGYHTAALKRFKQSLKSLSHSDEMLCHLLSFSSLSDYFMFPQSIVDGMPLLYIPPGQSKPVVTIEGENKSLQTLVNYWRSLCTLDINHWTHWFHTYKIPLVLNQDSALPLHLTHPSPTGRYTTVQCRVAASKLFSMLRSWSSIVLLENHSYVRLFPDPSSPRYFCLVRVVQMHPSLLVHLGFLEGTPWNLQQENLQLLKASIAELHLSLSSSDQPVTSQSTTLQVATGRTARKRSSRSLPHQSCAVIIGRQLQKVLVSYPLGNLGEGGAGLGGGEAPLQWGYMRHQRWQWRASQLHPLLLSALLRCRLREGFTVASSHNGMVSLVVEIQAKQPCSSTILSCLVQYVVSPISSATGSFFTDVWVEPQYLLVSKAPAGLKYLEDEKIDDIHYKIHLVDVQILTALCSYLECSSNSLLSQATTLSSNAQDSEGLVPSLFEQLGSGQPTEIQFKLSSLYSKSHVSAFTFSAFTEGQLPSHPITLDNCSPLNRTLHSRFLELLQQQQLNCSNIPLQEPNLVLARLNQSDQLNEFVRLFHSGGEGPSLLWRCFTLSQDDALFMIFTPCFLCPTHSPRPGLCLPLVVMATNLSTLLGPDHMGGGGCEPLPPDAYVGGLFGEEAESAPPTLVMELCERLKKIHTCSYLHSMHSILQQNGSVNEIDMKQALGVCNKALISIDVTPLLLAVCKHVCFYEEIVKGERSVSTCTLSVLLEQLGDQRISNNSSVCLDPDREGHPEGRESCQRRGEEIAEMLLTFLSSQGFRPIRETGDGYFWHQEQIAQRPTEKETTPKPVGDDNDERGSQSPPLSPDTTLRPKPIPFLSDESSGDEEWDLEPILSPVSDSSSPVLHVRHSPLFLHLSYSLKHAVKTRENAIGEENDEALMKEEQDESTESEDDKEAIAAIESEEKGLMEETKLPLCLDSLLSRYQVNTDSQCTLQLNLQFYSILDTNELTASPVKDCSSSELDPLKDLHQCFKSTANSLKWKIEWLVQDELLSRARELVGEGEPVSSSLLQSAASHVRGSSGRFSNCVFNHEPVKFVFGAKNSMNQFLQQLLDMDVKNYTVHKANDDYFYLMPDTPTISFHPRLSSPSPMTSLPSKRMTHGRCSTPSPSPAPHFRTHQRSVSWSAGPSQPKLSPSTTPINTLSPFSQAPHISRSSISSIVSESIADTGDYDASRSNSLVSVVSPVPTAAAAASHSCLAEDLFWLVMRILPSNVEVYVHNRCSVSSLLREESNSIKNLCLEIVAAIKTVCHKTNQWYLLKELLDTHVCSVLLLPESQSHEWVRSTISNQGDLVFGGERFLPQQFQCKSQWRQHITPHWRLRAMKNQKALKITRHALDAFAVTNRDDLYVLQDVTEGGEETVFYLKISESLCSVEGPDEEGEDVRCDTRATGEADTISNYSTGESHQLQSMQQLSSSSFSLNTKAQESIVLELFGMTSPSDTLQSRLQRKIQLKLDDAALEMMCSSYTRNQRLHLSPADVEFLQPSKDQPTEVVSLILPSWLPNSHAFFYYLLQQLSFVFLPPRYTFLSSGETDKKLLLAPPPELSSALSAAGLSVDIEQDYLFLYIRPVTKGRGMALISASLVSPEGCVLSPKPGLFRPGLSSAPPPPAETASVQLTECFPCRDQGWSVAFHIWEKGTVDLMELKQKLTVCVQRALMDAMFEMHYLHLPVASLSEEEMERKLSPGLRKRTSVSKTSSLDRSSYINVTLDSSLEGVVETTNDSSNNQTLNEIETERAPSVTEQVIDEGSDWEQRERLRRLQSARELLTSQAHTGQLGDLEEDYLFNIPQFLSLMKDTSSPVLFHEKWSFPSNSSIDITLSHTLTCLASTLTEMTFSLFKLTESGRYMRVPLPSQETTPTSYPPPEYVLIGRDLQQWKESKDSTDPHKHFEEIWCYSLMCLPLASWKDEPEMGVVPLFKAARKFNSFVPRHQFLMGFIGRSKFEVWLYNVIESRLRKIKTKLTNLITWQRTRSGFLHHLLTQKMGLFHHMSGRDIAAVGQLALKYCQTSQNVSTVVKQSGPVEELSSSGHLHLSRATAPQIELESFYHDRQPLSPLATTSSDPVSCHGQQFYKMLAHERDSVKQRELLGKVFESWEQRGIDYSAPISTEIIAKLKRTSRLLHFCSSPLLLFPDLKQFDTPLVDQDDNLWMRDIKEKFLKQYTSYLQTLKFHPINERPPASRSRHTPSPSHQPLGDSPLELYKCLQRSWSSGGIMLIELMFKGTVFHVMLYSIECSRLMTSYLPSFEASGLFSEECGRMKDYIHLHSFTYDFHIRCIQDMIRGQTKIEGTLNLHNLLDRFYKHYTNPPNFIRNRLCKETLTIHLSVSMESLFKHILSHCKEYHVQTLELIQSDNTNDQCSPTTLYDVGLMIDLSLIGNITTPEISQIIHNTRDQYHVIIIAIPNDQSDRDHTHKVLSLDMYMLLVNKKDCYPRLTVFSPLISRQTGQLLSSAGSSGRGEEEKESKFNVSVRDHRRKLGYGSLNTPSVGSDVVINIAVIDEQMNGLKKHFRNMVNTAQTHVRRNDLWKRLLYGGVGNRVEMEMLSAVEFQELLQLVTLCPFDAIDPELTPLQRQSKKWYRSLFPALEEKFQSTFKSFHNESNDDKYAVIINEEWQDMFILILLQSDGSLQHGFYSVYRNPQEGVVPREQRIITAYVEADHHHVSAVVNFACSFLWLKIINDTPTISKANKSTHGAAAAKLT